MSVTDNINTNTDAEDVSFGIEVRVPFSQAKAFADALTGNDDDIILAAETAMRERLGRGSDEEVELRAGPRMEALRATLGEYMAPCGCGATTAADCCAAVEGYFTSLGQRSGEELHTLAEGDGCEAARLMLVQRQVANA